MTNLQDAIGNLQSFADESRDSASALQASLKGLSDALTEICNGVDIHAVGDSCVLYECEPVGERTSGYLSFSKEGLSIAYRTHDDDMNDANQPDPYGPTYHVTSIDAAKPSWHLKLVQGGSLHSLLTRISDQLLSRTSELKDASKSVRSLLDSPTVAVSSSFEQVAEELGYHRAVEDWRKAESAIHLAPDSAITDACVLLETVCKHILDNLNEPFPSVESIQPLMKATAKALGLSPDGQAESELRGICSGLSTVVQNIGALRTRAGDAHGKDASFVSLLASHARLSVNAAGIAATFLMERWQSKKSGETPV